MAIRAWPVRRPRPTRWSWLGRLLPRDVRERIFEPAFADLLRAHLQSSERAALPFGVRAIAHYVRCLPIALPGLFYARGRVTRLGRVCLAGLSAVALVVVLVANLYRYPVAAP